eukprot:6211188-Pleurochrysis_carterae.AAC.1
MCVALPIRKLFQPNSSRFMPHASANRSARSRESAVVHQHASESPPLVKSGADSLALAAHATARHTRRGAPIPGRRREAASALRTGIGTACFRTCGSLIVTTEKNTQLWPPLAGQGACHRTDAHIRSRKASNSLSPSYLAGAARPEAAAQPAPAPLASPAPRRSPPPLSEQAASPPTRTPGWCRPADESGALAFSHAGAALADKLREQRHRL